MTTSPTAKFDVVGYAATDIPFIWPKVQGHIQAALDRGSDYSLQDIYEGLLNRDMQLWTYEPHGVDAALVTTIQNKDGKRWCLLLAAGGTKLEEWAPYVRYLESWARNQGCDEMRIYGRRGWSKVLGYEIDYCRMRKPLWTE